MQLALGKKKRVPQQWCCLFRLIFFLFLFFQQHGECACKCHLRALQRWLCPCWENRQQQRWAVPRAVLRLRPVLSAVPRRAFLRGKPLSRPQPLPCAFLLIEEATTGKSAVISSVVRMSLQKRGEREEPERGRKKQKCFYASLEDISVYNLI